MISGYYYDCVDSQAVDATCRVGTAHQNILHAVKNDTFHRNPKRKRGQKLRPLLTLWVTARVNRVQHNKAVTTTRAAGGSAGEPLASARG